jgi:hypothetical protein
MVLDQRGAVMNPIAVVDVPDGADQPLLGAMDMSADHTVDAMMPRGLEHRPIVEVAEELDRPPDAVFQVGGKGTGPVGGLTQIGAVPAVKFLQLQVSVIRFL